MWNMVRYVSRIAVLLMLLIVTSSTAKTSPSIAQDWASVHEQLQTSIYKNHTLGIELLESYQDIKIQWPIEDQIRFALRESDWKTDSLPNEQTIQIIRQYVATYQAITDSSQLFQAQLQLLKGMLALRESNLPLSYELISEAIPAIRSSGTDEDLAFALEYLSTSAQIVSKHESAKIAIREAIDIYEKTGNEIQQNLLLAYYASFVNQKDEERYDAETGALKSAEFFKEKGIPQGILESNIGLLNLNLIPVFKQPEMIAYITPIAQSYGNIKLEYVVECNRAKAWQRLNDTNKALDARIRQFELAKEWGQINYICWSAVDLGNEIVRSQMKGRNDEAIKALELAYQIAIKNEYNYNAILAATLLCQLYSERGYLLIAEAHLKNAQKLLPGEIKIHPAAKIKTLYAKAHLQYAKHEFEAASHTLLKLQEIENSNRSKDIKSEIDHSKRQFHSEIRRSHLAIARNETIIAEEKLLEKEKLLQLQKEEHEKLRKRHFFWLVAAIIGTVCVVVFTTVAVFRYRLLNKKRTLYQQLLREESRLQSMDKNNSNLNDELHNTNALLESQSIEQRKLLQIATHDMRNPLGAIQLSMDMLRNSIFKGDSTDEFKQLVKVATNGVELIDTCLNNIQTLQEETRRYKNLKIEPVDVIPLLQETIALNDVHLQRKSISISIINTSKTLVMKADRKAFRFVMDNLISNAIKYSPEGSKVTIYTESTYPNGRMRVEDEGCGIPEEEYAELFQPFPKISTKPTSSEHSTGLGLYSSKLLVDRMGGTIGIESKRSKGAAFWIEFPIVS